MDDQHVYADKDVWKFIAACRDAATKNIAKEAKVKFTAVELEEIVQVNIIGSEQVSEAAVAKAELEELIARVSEDICSMPVSIPYAVEQHRDHLTQIIEDTGDLCAYQADDGKGTYVLVGTKRAISSAKELVRKRFGKQSFTPRHYGSKGSANHEDDGLLQKDPASDATKVSAGYEENVGKWIQLAQRLEDRDKASDKMAAKTKQTQDLEEVAEASRLPETPCFARDEKTAKTKQTHDLDESFEAPRLPSTPCFAASPPSQPYEDELKDLINQIIESGDPDGERKINEILARNDRPVRKKTPARKLSVAIDEPVRRPLYDATRRKVQDTDDDDDDDDANNRLDRLLQAGNPDPDEIEAIIAMHSEKPQTHRHRKHSPVSVTKRKERATTKTADSDDEYASLFSGNPAGVATRKKKATTQIANDDDDNEVLLGGKHKAIKARTSADDDDFDYEFLLGGKHTAVKARTSADDDDYEDDDYEDLLGGKHKAIKTRTSAAKQRRHSPDSEGEEAEDTDDLHMLDSDEDQDDGTVLLSHDEWLEIVEAAHPNHKRPTRQEHDPKPVTERAGGRMDDGRARRWKDMDDGKATKKKNTEEETERAGGRMDDGRVGRWQDMDDGKATKKKKAEEETERAGGRMDDGRVGRWQDMDDGKATKKKKSEEETERAGGRMDDGRVGRWQDMDDGKATKTKKSEEESERTSCRIDEDGKIALRKEMNAAQTSHLKTAEPETIRPTTNTDYKKASTKTKEDTKDSQNAGILQRGTAKEEEEVLPETIGTDAVEDEEDEEDKDYQEWLQLLQFGVITPQDFETWNENRAILKASVESPTKSEPSNAATQNDQQKPASYPPDEAPKSVEIKIGGVREVGISEETSGFTKMNKQQVDNHKKMHGQQTSGLKTNPKNFATSTEDCPRHEETSGFNSRLNEEQADNHTKMHGQQTSGLKTNPQVFATSTEDCPRSEEKPRAQSELDTARQPSDQERNPQDLAISQPKDCPRSEEKPVAWIENGPQPEGGEFNALKVRDQPLPGHEEDPHYVEITITFPKVEGAHGSASFICLFPGSLAGHTVVHQVRNAYLQRRLFRVRAGTVRWNGFTPKTEPHGYPDPFYLDQAQKELDKILEN